MKLEVGLVGVELAMRGIWGQAKKDTVIITTVRYIIYTSKECKGNNNKIIIYMIYIIVMEDNLILIL